jgi:hypothetical protein
VATAAFVIRRALKGQSHAFPRKSIHTEISPLRCAPVEMTKGRGALPCEEQSLNRNRLGGPSRLY